MITPVIDYFNSIYPMPDELVEDLYKLAIIREFNKNDLILKEGQVSNHTSWILKGLVRSYYVKDVEEVTTKFLWEQATITSVYSYYSRKPGNDVSDASAAPSNSAMADGSNGRTSRSGGRLSWCG